MVTSRPVLDDFDSQNLWCIYQAVTLLRFKAQGSSAVSKDQESDKLSTYIEQFLIGDRVAPRLHYFCSLSHFGFTDKSRLLQGCLFVSTSDKGWTCARGCVTSILSDWQTAYRITRTTVFTTRRYASAVYATGLCLSVYLSVTSRCCTKMAKFDWGHPNGDTKRRWGGLKSANFDK